MCLTTPTPAQNYFIACKATNSEWSPEQGKDLQQVQAALPSGPVNPEDLMVTRVYVTNRDAVTSLWQVLEGDSRCSLSWVVSYLKGTSHLAPGPLERLNITNK